MQPALDCLHAQPENFRYFRGGESFHVSKHQHLSTCRLQAGDGAFERALHFLTRQHLVRHRGRVGAFFRFLLGRSCDIVARQVRIFAPVLDAEAAGNGVEPGRQRRRPFKLTHSSGHRDQRVLQDILCGLGIATHLDTEAIDLRLMSFEQLLERRPITRSRSLEQERA